MRGQLPGGLGFSSGMWILNVQNTSRHSCIIKNIKFSTVEPKIAKSTFSSLGIRVICMRIEGGPSPSCISEIRPPRAPPMRSVLPASLVFFFECVNKYLEDLVAWIDAPQLDVCNHQAIYDIPHFRVSQFVRPLSVGLCSLCPNCPVIVRLELGNGIFGAGLMNDNENPYVHRLS